MMKALMIAPQPFFSPRGTPFSVYYRALVMTRLGVEIDLLTYGQGQDVDLPGLRIIRIPRFGFLGPVPIGPSLLKLFLDVLLCFRAVILLTFNRYDFVHAHEEAVFFCRILKPIFGFKLVYDMHSSLPQQLTNFGFLVPRLRLGTRLVMGLFERLENPCLAGADAVITICPDLAEFAEKKMPDPSRHYLIENSIFDEVRLKHSQNHEGHQEEVNVPEDRPLVLYAGTFEPYQGLDVLIQAACKVRRQVPDVLFVLAGGTEKQVAEMKQKAANVGVLDHCLFVGRVPKEVVKRLLHKASVVVSPRVQGTNTPLKIYELLASGTPLVATRIHSHTQVLSDDVCTLVEPQPQAMAEGILTAWRNPELLRRRAKSAIELYEKKYARAVYETKMQRLIDCLQCVVSPELSR